MDIGLAIPQTFPDGQVDVDLVRHALERSDACGLHSVWVQEQIVGRMPTLEPLALLTFAAALTSRVALGSAVLLPALRSPLHLAKSLAALDHLCHGRLIVGVGLGANLALYPAYGLSPADRVRRFTEGLTLVRRLWTEPAVTFHGRFWRLSGVAMEPKPVQRPHPPLWLGAHHPQAIERAAAWADGFIGAGAARSPSSATRSGCSARRWSAGDGTRTGSR